MGQVLVNPDEIRSFIVELNRFKDEMDINQKQLKAKLNKLGESWNDNEQQKFNNNFETFLKNLTPFSSNIDEYSSFLQRKANALHRSIYIKDTTILDNIKTIFNNSLIKLQENIEDAKSKYMNILKYSEEKVEDVSFIVNNYANEISKLEQEAYSINLKINSLDAELISLNGQLLNAKEEYQRSSIQNKISMYKTKIASSQNDLNYTKSKIYTVKTKLDNNRHILTNIRNIPADIQDNIDKYNYEINYLKTEASNILDDTFKAIESIKNTIDNYQSVQSSSPMNSFNTKSTNSRKYSSSQEKQEIKKTNRENNTLDLDEVVNFELQNTIYKILNTKKINRFTSELYLNDSKIAKISFKLKNESISILNYRGNNFNTIEVLTSYICTIGQKDLNLKSISIWAKESDISNFINLKFTQNGELVKGDGVNMIKKIIKSDTQ